MHSYDPKWFRMKYGSLLRSIVSRANRRKRSRRSSAVCDADANPPAPTFEPPRPSNDIFFVRCARPTTTTETMFFFFFFFFSHSKGFQSNWTTRESEKKSVRRFRDERREKTNTPRTQHRLPRCTTRVKPNRCYYSCTKTSLYIYMLMWARARRGPQGSFFLAGGHPFESTGDRLPAVRPLPVVRAR